MVTGQKIRQLVLEQSARAHVGHIGSALCVADVIAALYQDVLHLPGPKAPDRDRFILSKGHAALALYAALHLKGWLSGEDIATYCADGTLLGVHPDHQLPGVDFTTGSLGQGLSIGAGVALAARLRGDGYRAFVLVSDAECNEGALWEAAMFAAHHRLVNLVAIVDVNGQQALGATRDILDLEPLAGRWQSFGWDVQEVDGHSPHLMTRCLKGLDDRQGQPHVVLARTVFGRGVSFMERRLAWHYSPMNESQYHQAMAEVSGLR